MLQAWSYKRFLKFMPHSMEVLGGILACTFAMLIALTERRARALGWRNERLMLVLLVFAALFVLTRWHGILLNVSLLYAYGVLGYFASVNLGEFEHLFRQPTPAADALVIVLCALGAVAFAWDLYFVIFGIKMP